MNTSIFCDKVLSKVGIKETEENYEYIKYGFEIFIINLSKLGIIYSIALITKQFFPTLIVHLSYLFLRHYSFGLHATSSLSCTIISVILFNILPFFAKGIQLPTPFLVLTSLFILISIFLFAPADTENNPICGADHRKKLKIKATISCLLLLSLVFISSNPMIQTLILLGGIFQTISILPVTYKLLKRRYNNYELFS